MKNGEYTRIEFLLERLVRLNQAKAWENDLNPAQMAALEYLSQANKFSRAPSHVADYLGATRGTTSQTLKALSNKGLVQQVRSAEDKRSVRYDVTEKALPVLGSKAPLADSIVQLDKKEASHIASLLNNMLHMTLRNNGGKTFGICKSCKHHSTQDGRPYCRLLSVGLAKFETEQICQEHALIS